MDVYFKFNKRVKKALKLAEKARVDFKAAVQAVVDILNDWLNHFDLYLELSQDGDFIHLASKKKSWMRDGVFIREDVIGEPVMRWVQHSLDVVESVLDWEGTWLLIGKQVTPSNFKMVVDRLLDSLGQ